MYGTIRIIVAVAALSPNPKNPQPVLSMPACFKCTSIAGTRSPS